MEQDHVRRKRGSVGVRRPEPAERICVERGRFVYVTRISSEIRGTFQEAQDDRTVKVATGNKTGSCTAHVAYVGPLDRVSGNS